MAVTAPYLPYDRLRIVSDKFLQEYHPEGTLPVPIEDIVEFKFELDIVPVPGLKSEFDVDAFITHDLKEIRVDEFFYQHRPNRYRFSLAHELAHVLIHKNVFDRLQFSTIAEWKSVIASIPSDQYRFIELQAYSLGGLMLVPRKPLAAMFADTKTKAEAAGFELTDLGKKERRIIEENIGQQFGVSADVICKRMKYDKLWPDC